MTRKNSTHPFRICNFARWIGATLLLGLLSACNLGGDEDSVQATTSVLLATSSASPAPTATSVATSTQTPATTCSITAFQAAVVAEVNRRRASAQSCGSRGGFAATGSLRWSDPLFRAAAGHAKDMVANQFFAHTGSDGSSVSARINAIGYAWASVGENIAAGQPTVARVVEAWMASDGHCANLMNPAMEEFAVACVYNTANRSNYWVMELAKPR
ncbi:CAP domain-containing protein [Sphaerotilus sp.]|uniref:CAP domain-containing protein n=1 Tax=Sphaerotilus sp. TaxID=2093942 RepID=UPI002ACD2595|nr:CAP domain-containing protein [Sphaerotilus sp.]MDZ7858667.1 CAP domain-containing protein [Sphaerotilus sp.]